jgi:hypothetical protein
MTPFMTQSNLYKKSQKISAILGIFSDIGTFGDISIGRISAKSSEIA